MASEPPGRREPHLSAKLQGFGTTIFVEMSDLAVATGAINLSQGFPDTDGPTEVLDAAVAAIRAGHNQYPPRFGIPELRRAIAAHQRRFWDLDPDPDGEVLVTAGATEAIAAAMLALVDVGDEVVVFEPTYDSYVAGIAMAGGTPRAVGLEPPEYRFDPDELRRAVTARTKAIVVNSPHNPTGTVLADDQLAAIAEVACERDLVVITDEVYEHLTFDGVVHRPLATLPGMAERTLTVSSAGKTFRVTGWKVGWITGPAELVDAVACAKQFLTFVTSGPLQHGVAVGLGLGDDYFTGAAAELASARDVLCAGLEAAGFGVLRPSATYFVTADIRPLDPSGDGAAFCRALPGRCGVAAVPCEAFYDPARAHRGRHLVRFAFSKRPEVIDEAVERLTRL